MNTHYAVLSFSGDPDGEHPDEELRGRSPHLTLIASGSEYHCWQSLFRWTEKHPLRMWEDAEVVMRHPSIVRRDQHTRSEPTPMTNGAPDT